jgi:hypothetical protein
MNATLFREISDAVNVAEETKVLGPTKRTMVMEVIQRSIGRDAYLQHASMVGLMIDTIVSMKRLEVQKDAIVSMKRVDVQQSTPIPRRRSMFSFFYCFKDRIRIFFKRL